MSAAVSRLSVTGTGSGSVTSRSVLHPPARRPTPTTIVTAARAALRIPSTTPPPVVLSAAIVPPGASGSSAPLPAGRRLRRRRGSPRGCAGSAPRPARPSTGRRSSPSSYTSGSPVGMLSSTMSASLMSSRCFTRARRLLPWAPMSTVRPARRSGAMASSQYGRRRATTSARHSVSGSCSGGHLGVALVVVRVVLVVGADRRRRHVVAAAPHLHLVGPVARRRLRLVAAR